MASVTEKRRAKKRRRIAQSSGDATSSKPSLADGTKLNSHRRTIDEPNTETEPRHPSASERMTSPFALCLFSGILLWLAMPTFPATALSMLAWIAPLGWLILIGQPKLSGNRPLLQIYIASMIHCLLVYSFVRLPHWSANFGWIALCLYLALYPFAFVLLTRVAVHRLKLSVVFAAPIVWTGLELARGHVLSGLSTALLGHTQIHWNRIIQISDLGGAYAVSFLVMLVSACLYRLLAACWSTRQNSATDVQTKPVKQRLMPMLWPVIVGIAVMVGALGYGHTRTNGNFEDATKEPLHVALIQGSIDTIFPTTDQKYEHHAKQIREQYRQLSVQARTSGEQVDVIVWPETMFQNPAVVFEEEGMENISAEELQEWEYRSKTHALSILDATGSIRLDRMSGRWVPTELKQVNSIIGMSTQVPGTDQHFNSAMLVDANGTIQNRYHKMHPVPFGEFIPFGELIPALYLFAPISGPLTPGEQPEAFQVGELRIAPSICFESIVPHLIRRQVCELQSRGEDPDVLLNITNDGWFWGSNLLDLHLTCNAFRAVELRKPVLVCANTGFSAEIDAAGRVLQRGPRRDTGVVYADILPDRRASFYQRSGDWPAGCCLLLTGVFLGYAVICRFRAGNIKSDADNAQPDKPSQPANQD